MAEQTNQDGPAASRRWLPLALVVLATLIGILAILAIWAKRQVLETDSWVETSTELLEDQEIRDELAGFLVDSLYESVDVEAAIRQELPPEAKPLAGPAAGALRQAADEVAKQALEQPAVQALWAEANRTAHQALIKVVEGGGDNVSTSGGDVTLNLTEILTQLTQQLGLPGTLVSKLPPDAASLEIIKSDELGAAQDAVDLLETLVWVLTILGLGLYALAVYLAGERRRETLRAVGFGFIAMGLAVLVIQSAAGDAVVDSLSDSATGDPAVRNTWEIATGLLTEGAGAAILYGIAIVVAAWFAGPTRIATRARYAIAPYLRQPRLAYAGLAVILVLLFWWAPTPATERFVPSLILIGVLVLGTEMLRRRTSEEFPERVTTLSAAGMAQTMAQQTRESIGARVRARSERQQAEAAGSRLEALERLARLRESGALTEAEFEAEKARLVGTAGVPSSNVESSPTTEEE